MVDLHCHILPGIDDGPENMEISMAMAESAIADGITHVVATPHSSNEYPFDYRRVRDLRDELQAKIGARLLLATGCDFHLNPENLADLREDPPRFCINQKDYLLVEFSEYSIPPSMDQTLHEIQLMGIRPIITHPERNRILRQHTERLAKWVRLGCSVQVTAGSLSGVFGTGAQKDVWRWMADGLVHFVASDAHNTGRRPLKLKSTYELIREKCGEEKAHALLADNPMAAFEGRTLPYVPEQGEGGDIPRRKRFYFF
ncbi:MAG TPA: CpsB/CapC family capsule biosynthesis tyrosine phosphatase [Candidatus Solibacter sp.]|nr:CpsB/CapC family capsule biosynthesis tyrosine phosphatase [Candidatus Solibacter sp.]